LTAARASSREERATRASPSAAAARKRRREWSRGPVCWKRGSGEDESVVEEAGGRLPADGESEGAGDGCIFRLDCIGHIVDDTKGANEDANEIICFELVEDKDSTAGKEGVVDTERGVLGRRGDEAQRPCFDRWQEEVLLSLVETLDLVDEEERLATSELEDVLRFGEDGAKVGGGSVRCAQLLEYGRGGLGNDPRNGRFASPAASKICRKLMTEKGWKRRGK
jgi:hypothetical protein